MTLAVLPVRAEGWALGEFLTAGFMASGLDASLLRPWEGDASPRELLSSRFTDFSGWVLLMASGIATRFLSGLPESKLSDPAVVCSTRARASQSRFSPATRAGPTRWLTGWQT